MLSLTSDFSPLPTTNSGTILMDFRLSQQSQCLPTTSEWTSYQHHQQLSENLHTAGTSLRTNPFPASCSLRTCCRMAASALGELWWVFPNVVMLLAPSFGVGPATLAWSTTILNHSSPWSDGFSSGHMSHTQPINIAKFFADPREGPVVGKSSSALLSKSLHVVGALGSNQLLHKYQFQY